MKLEDYNGLRINFQRNSEKLNIDLKKKRKERKKK